MKQRQRESPLAFCVELNEIITPHKAHKQIVNNPDSSYIYTCMVCHKPLVLRLDPHGFLRAPFFRGRGLDSHKACLDKIYGHYVGAELKYHLDFEETLAEAASTAEKLEVLLDHLEVTYHEYWQHTDGQASSLPLGVSLDLALSFAVKRYKELETILMRIETLYNESQLPSG